MWKGPFSTLFLGPFHRRGAKVVRHIVISTDVFAALWASRKAGEDSENAILERMLGLPKGPPLMPQQFGPHPGNVRPTDGSIFNQMFDVHFPKGFEIFRTYKGKDYSAVVREGRWVMGARSYPSLFALSMAIIDSRENPWMHWKYRDTNGRVATISNLRNIPPELEERAVKDEKPAKKKAKRIPKKNTAGHGGPL
jgi:hypothetical protein